MRRRTYIVTASGLGLATLAGCLGDDDDETGDDETGDGETDASQTDDGSDGDSGDESMPEPVATVDAYIEAAEAEDDATLAELAYEESPLHPDWIEDAIDEANEDGDGEWSEAEQDPLDVADVTLELVAEDVDLDEARDRVEGLAFWFEMDDLEDRIDGEGTALVRSEWTNNNPGEIDPRERVEEEHLWVLFTEDDEWTILWQGEIPGTPEEFEDPIEDDGRLVADIEYEETEGHDDGHDDGDEDPLIDPDEFRQATVTFVDEPDPDIDVIVVETTIAGSETWTENPQQTRSLGTQVDSAGDEVVVTAYVDDEPEVVHRERYEP